MASCEIHHKKARSKSGTYLQIMQFCILKSFDKYPGNETAVKICRQVEEHIMTSYSYFLSKVEKYFAIDLFGDMKKLITNTETKIHLHSSKKRTKLSMTAKFGRKLFWNKEI